MHLVEGEPSPPYACWIASQLSGKTPADGRAEAPPQKSWRQVEQQDFGIARIGADDRLFTPLVAPGDRIARSQPFAIDLDRATHALQPVTPCRSQDRKSVV